MLSLYMLEWLYCLLAWNFLFTVVDTTTTDPSHGCVFTDAEAKVVKTSGEHIANEQTANTAH